MGEPGQHELITPQPLENPFSGQSLTAIFTDPKFIKNISNLAKAATIEGGFVVYRGVGGKPAVISKVVRNNLEDDAEDGKERGRSETTTPIPQLTNRYDQYGTPTLRDDLVFVIHSHPDMDIKHPVYQLPSETDLSIWEFRRMKNPYTIDAVIIRRDNTTATIFAYQIDPGKPQSNNYQQWQLHNGLPYFLRLLGESGIRHQTLTFDLKSRQFTQAELEKVMTFAI